MGQFSVEIISLPGSVLGGNQQVGRSNRVARSKLLGQLSLKHPP